MHDPQLEPSATEGPYPCKCEKTEFILLIGINRHVVIVEDGDYDNPTHCPHCNQTLDEAIAAAEDKYETLRLYGPEPDPGMFDDDYDY